MSLKITRSAYQKLIDGDLAWLRITLRDQPRTPERDHIAMVLAASVDLYYPPVASPSGVGARLQGLEAQRQERLEWIKLGGVQEDVDLIDVFRGWYSTGAESTYDDECWRRVIELLEARVKASGATVRACTAEDMEPAAHPPEGGTPRVQGGVPASERRPPESGTVEIHGYTFPAPEGGTPKGEPPHGR